MWQLAALGAAISLGLILFLAAKWKISMRAAALGGLAIAVAASIPFVFIYALSNAGCCVFHPDSFLAISSAPGALPFFFSTPRLLSRLRPGWRAPPPVL